MRKALLAGLTGIMFLAGGSFADIALAKKGGVGKGGGYSDDGVRYHSHSDRSYSGKDYMKGKAVGHTKTKKGKGKAKGHSKKAPLE
ncbi:MAG: hypothetical protein ABFD97_09940 [Syntrophobacter sp.]